MRRYVRDRCILVPTCVMYKPVLTRYQMITQVYKPKPQPIQTNASISPLRAHIVTERSIPTMALIPIMAARITTSTLGGTMSARALMKATPAMTNKNNTKALTAPFCQRENEVTTQDKQLSRYIYVCVCRIC